MVREREPTGCHRQIERRSLREEGKKKRAEGLRRFLWVAVANTKRRHGRPGERAAREKEKVLGKVRGEGLISMSE